MNDARQPQLDAPQLRTLLLTDLCDSTELVEKHGDARAAELFREHDALVLDLQQQWRGRLIDRSDGLLLLFERPIDGLGFALDYQRGLDQLGRAQKLTLRARAGLHVGEVLTWRNSEEAVQIGAKPLEVEGLAKPTAARLMALARPGQILVSAVAESLTHRAARELGERGEQLLWKSYGRWRFKGMPTAMEIYEVGEVGRAQLRGPKNSPKAWRDIPLWRRPAALVAEVALVAAIGVGTWVVTRPAPALAFAERDWVVVGDMRNLTGDPLLDDSLQQAFRISLEQSRYVNVLSDLKVRQTLTLMQKNSEDTVDRASALEVAQREGIRYVLLPSIAEVGGKVRVSAEVVDPANGNTVFATHQDGRGLESVLASVDEVVQSLRLGFGETVASASQTSAPLPQVATASLDALKAYAMGQEAYAKGELDASLRYFGQAVELDPNFALAHAGMMRVHVRRANTISANSELERALAVSARLPKRDALYLRAWKAQNIEGGSDAAERWKTLADLYPDFHPASANYGWLALVARNYMEAERYSMAAVSAKNPLSGLALEQAARAQLALGEYAKAIQNFRRADAEMRNSSTLGLAAALAANGQLKAAQEIADQRKDVTTAGATFVRASLAMHAGAGTHAASIADAYANSLREVSPLLERDFRLTALSALVGSEPGEEVRQKLYVYLDGAQKLAVDPANADRADDQVFALYAIYLLQRLGDERAAAKYLPKLRISAGESENEVAIAMRTVVAASQERLLGNPKKSIEMLSGPAAPTLFQARVALRDALIANGDVAAAKRENEALKKRIGEAYAEAAGSYVFQALNVADASTAGAPRPKALDQSVARR